MRHLLEILGDMFLIMNMGFLSWVFIYIKIYGEMRIVENNPYVWWAELIRCPAIALLGGYLLWRDLKRRL